MPREFCTRCGARYDGVTAHGPGNCGDLRPSVNTIGTFWVDEHHRVWQHISYTDQPTATFHLVEDQSKRLSGVVGSPILQGLRRLVAA